MGMMINSDGHAIKASRNDIYRALLELNKRDYQDGKITTDDYINFLRTQMRKYKSGQ